MTRSPTVMFLLFFPFLSGLFFPQNVHAETSDLSCEFHMFQVDSTYKLPYKYDTAQITNSSWVKVNSYYVYSFVVKTKDDERKELTNVQLNHVAGAKEPIEILDSRPQNGSCTVNNGNKSVACNLSYSFTQSAHYPVEYLVKIKADPEFTTTSSLFYLTTSAGTAQCANWLQIKKPTHVANPVTWETPYAKLLASDFFIRIGDRTFYGKQPIYVHSDPGVDRTTLEVTWQENNVEMRLFLYFKRVENNMWELYEMRSYNGEPRGDWIYYRESLGNTISSLIGQHNYADTRTFVPTDGKDAQIYCKACDINAFMPRPVQTSPAGYSLEALIGLTRGETITISTDPRTGYGVNVVLRDTNKEVVKQQSEFLYQWSSDNPDVLSLSPGNLDYGNNSCAYGILPPCPNNHVDMRGLAPGDTTVTVKVVRQTDNAILAQTSFPVKVIAFNVLQQIPTIFPTGTISADRQELINVKRDLARISEELKSQKQEVNAIQQLIDAIKLFLTKTFGITF